MEFSNTEKLEKLGQLAVARLLSNKKFKVLRKG
jgi:hypothetical protein